jgi:glycosyltransferase involved in cell wall biosynthesis
MRVLHVTPSYAPAYGYGGPIQSVERLVAALARLGVEQRVVTTNADGDRTLDVPRGWTSRNGVPTKYLPRWRAPDIAPSLLPEAFESSRWADVVHVTGVFCVPSVLGLMAARAAAKPTILSTRGALQPVAMQTRPDRKQAWLRLFSNIYDDVGVFHATAEHEARAIEETFGANRRLVIIPNGTEPFTDAEVSALCSDGPLSPPLIGMLGRLHPIKAVDRVLDALDLLQRAGVVARLQFAGPVQDLAYRDSLLAQADRLGLANRFELLGPLHGMEKLRFYARCSVLVVASHSENFSNVVVEALNLRTPVVASLGTPWAELAEAGCGAWVANQPESLADAIAPFITSPRVRLEAGAAGRHLVQRKYTWPTIARQMAELYDSVGFRAGAGTPAGPTGRCRCRV